MRLGLLCDDANGIPWLDAIAETPHEVTVAAALTPGMFEMLRGRSGIRLTRNWEELLGSRDFDAILVGGTEQHLLDAARQLASVGHPLLFLPHRGQGSTFIYELSLVRDDNQVLICPANWHRCDQVLLALRRQIQEGELGHVNLLRFEREFHCAGSAKSIPLSTLDETQLYDFDLLRWLIGDYDQVTALRTEAAQGGVLTQSVKLAGRSLAEATWTAMTGSVDSCRLTIFAEKGQLQVQQDPDTSEWLLQDTHGNKHAGSRKKAIGSFLDQFAAALPGDAATSRQKCPVEWPELVKDFETVDATHRSLKRRRTIDLHFEPMSERAIFKTQMTAMGCGVLVATFLLTLVYLAVASTVPLPEPVLRVVRLLVFLPLGIFLLLQMLYPLTRPSAAEGKLTEPTDNGPARDLEKSEGS